MKDQFGIRGLLQANPIIPVASIEDVSAVSDVLAGLSARGVNCIEITLRSKTSFAVLQKAIECRPDGFKVGVGTIVNAKQVEKCHAIGVDFLVSPGLTPKLSKAFKAGSIPFLPGVMTPSEIIIGMSYGFQTFKLFPFNLAGGEKALKAYGNVFPAVKFCPTGGISEDIAANCLDMKNVLAVGGSWLV
ncbi:MAG: 2-dehydro-3-deoxyphosphogluconate aldolase/(4S)-4-hydroxy-2-oxoglutarate aldolase [Flavobacteriales bacterium]|jgi:2-dehydro-3-deoxyphosphogluconate aldolase/(4S)-4-hydroxy-2-oxoglutarate aldolase